jgi:hypothetical protein
MRHIFQVIACIVAVGFLFQSTAFAIQCSTKDIELDLDGDGQVDARTFSCERSQAYMAKATGCKINLNVTEFVCEYTEVPNGKGVKKTTIIVRESADETGAQYPAECSIGKEPSLAKNCKYGELTKTGESRPRPTFRTGSFEGKSK